MKNVNYSIFAEFEFKIHLIEIKLRDLVSKMLRQTLCVIARIWEPRLIETSNKNSPSKKKPVFQRTEVIRSFNKSFRCVLCPPCIFFISRPRFSQLPTPFPLESQCF